MQTPVLQISKECSKAITPDELPRNNPMQPAKKMNVVAPNRELGIRVSQSLIILILRQMGVNGTIFLGNIFISRWVKPEVYGLFAATLAFQATLMIFADFGFGPALIQRVAEPTREELASLFTTQLILFCGLSGVVWLLAPWLASLYELADEGIWIIRVLSLVLGITAFRSIPALLLERDLQFTPIATAEIIGTLAYQGVLLGLVWAGYGVMSIAWALLARYLCDIVIIWFALPWKPSLTFNLKNALPYLGFGLNMQGVKVMAYCKDQLPLLLLVPLLGLSSAGIWGWAMTYVAVPIYFNRLVERIMFPAFARSQHDRRQLGELVTAALWLNFAIGLPLLFMLVVFAPNMIQLIYGETWLIAIPVVVALSFNMLGGFVTGILFNFLYGLGKPNKAFQLFALWVGLTGVFAMIGVMMGQLLGLAVGFSVATLSICAILFYIMRSLITIDLKPIWMGPGAASGVALILTLLLSPSTLPWLVILAIALLGYALTFFVIDRVRIFALIRGNFINL